MNAHSSRPRRSRTAAFALIALAALAGLNARPALAANGGEIARFFAVGGTVASWSLAWWQGAKLNDCGEARWQGRAQFGKDKELKLSSAGVAYGECKLLTQGDWALSYQPSLMLSHWEASGSVSGARSAQDVAFVPLLHWQRGLSSGLKLEAEVGVGPTWLSQPSIGNRIKSTQFQFSDSVGLGVSDSSGRWRVGLTWRHISNSDIKTPNQAADFKGLTLAFAL